MCLGQPLYIWGGERTTSHCYSSEVWTSSGNQSRKGKSQRTSLCFCCNNWSFWFLSVNVYIFHLVLLSSNTFLSIWFSSKLFSAQSTALSEQFSSQVLVFTVNPTWHETQQNTTECKVSSTNHCKWSMLKRISTIFFINALNLEHISTV